MAYRSSPSPKRSSYGSSSRGNGSCYYVPETPKPPQTFRSSAPEAQMPPSDAQMISQRKQMAGTK